MKQRGKKLKDIRDVDLLIKLAKQQGYHVTGDDKEVFFIHPDQLKMTLTNRPKPEPILEGEKKLKTIYKHWWVITGTPIRYVCLNCDKEDMKATTRPDEDGCKKQRD